jgi:hypothetical protein
MGVCLRREIRIELQISDEWKTITYKNGLSLPWITELQKDWDEMIKGRWSILEKA